MRILVITLVLLLSFTGENHAQSAALQKLLAAEGLKSAAVGISVKRVDNGGVIVAHNPAMALSPASVTKLLTTVAALAEKGEDFNYKTHVGYTGEIKDGTLQGNIVIDASGDPSLDSKYFQTSGFIGELAQKIQQAGIKTVSGNILLRGDFEKTLPGSWLWEDISNYYAAPYHGFNYRDNTYEITFRSAQSGQPAEFLSVVPEQPGIHFINEVKASEKNSDDAWIFGGPYSQHMYIKGTIPANRTSFKIKGAIHHPAASFVNELTALLKKQGVSIEDRKQPETSVRKLYTHLSPSLKEIVYRTNKSSVNLYAEALGSLIAAEDYQGAMAACLKKKNIDASGMILKDACGLSPLNAVSASIFTDALIWADKNLGQPFVFSLPVAGTDAGLNGYCAGYPVLKGNLQAKTGSFAGVRCLSGYIKNKSGQKLAFTILINNYTCPSSRLYNAVGAFLSSLAAE